MEEIMPGLYRIEVPLPGNPLKAVNSYVIKDKERDLIIDTGMNRPECREALEAGLEELEVERDRTDIFITHVHADHLGLAGEISGSSSRVYFNRPDIELLRRDIWERMGSFAARCGFPVEELRRALERHPGNRYSPSRELTFTFLQEGDLLSTGGYQFKCLETPGHTPGSICLYEPHKKIMVTGDHVLGDITPNISLWSEDANPLQLYMASLDKIFPLEVSRVLPGHRRLFNDLQGRIKELKKHHQLRLAEIQELLGREALNPYQLASRMSWDIEAKSWEEFPITQRWFATGEAMAHLKYMEEKGMLEHEANEKELISFRLA